MKIELKFIGQEIMKLEFKKTPNSIKDKNIYISFDLDVDSSIMLTGTPEPGGLSWYQALNIKNNL